MKGIKVKMYYFQKRDGGSVTVEAAIALPVFVCMIVTIVFLIKVVYTHEVIQHAIDETANEMANSSYLYHISGLQGVHDSVRDGIKSESELFESHISSVFDAYEGLSGELEEGSENAQDILESLEDMLNAGEDAVENPLQELKSVAFAISEGAFDDLKTQVCIPIAKLYLKKYLKSHKIKNVDLRLRDLNVIQGFNGLDFSKSEFFADGNNNIDIIVMYKINIPVPVKIVPAILVVQRATAKAWLGGDGEGVANAQTGEEDIWSLGNFQRGTRIRALFGANMPYNFPLISKFDSGTATVIKSMDLTTKTYQQPDALEEKVSGYINELAKYRGQEEPWGSKGIVVREAEIKSRELLLVIPENPVGDEVGQTLDRLITTAALKGVTLRIQKYGTKKIAEENAE